jgi:protein SCO1/2
VVRALTILLCFAGITLAIGPARAESQLPPSLQGVGFDQKLGAQLPLELAFRDEAGRSIRLGDYFKERPVILVLAYYRCPMLCTQVLNNLVRALLEVPLAAGRDFQVVVVSFDPREKPELAAAKKKSYLERYGRPGAAEGWHFLTGDQEPIDQLTRAVGFRYRYDPVNDQFAHASGILVVTPKGQLSRYFYDIAYEPRDLRLGLVEASGNRIGSLADQVLLYCFHYNPAEGKYGATVMTLLRISGVLTILAVAAMIYILRRQERRATPSRPLVEG